MTPNTLADMAQNFPAMLTLDDFEAATVTHDASKVLWPLALDRNDLALELTLEGDLNETITTAARFYVHVVQLAALAKMTLHRLEAVAGDVMTSTRTAEV